MIVNRFENWRRVLSGRPWELAFDFLGSLRADSPEGDTPLDGDAVFGRVMAYKTRSPEEGLLESHRLYIDVQTTLDGAEGIEWFPRDTLAVKQAYDPVRDFELWQRPGPPSVRLDMVPGMFCVLFPEDAHLAQQIVGGAPREIRKAVVKIRLDSIQR
jgi:YhcH/YjgK/YiaL family protein